MCRRLAVGSTNNGKVGEGV
ncbi:hypothetical protein E2C01_097045 [Portunus trituberculatus]|uniref:Uncharacterized protein n=1 Tax=Portunus trituberculatus TaxID=210409 RepID=A0A5B7JZE6_PORTR|nr:hypothetical protein [Portunus trituberculatus]